MAIGKRKKVVGEISDLDDFQVKFGKLLDDMSANPDKYKEMGKEVIGNPITIGSRVIDAKDWKDKQIVRATAAADEWKKKILKPKKNPVEAAIKANDKRVDKLMASIKEKKWEKAMARVDMDIMYKVIEATDPAAFSGGIERRAAKIEAVYKDLQPMVLALAESIDAMPDKSDADREKRLLAARRGMIEIGKKRRGL